MLLVCYEWLEGVSGRSKLGAWLYMNGRGVFTADGPFRRLGFGRDNLGENPHSYSLLQPAHAQRSVRRCMRTANISRLILQDN